jgi:hypothetical protein
MLFSVLGDLIEIGIANFVIWSIVSYLLVESPSPAFLKYSTRVFVIMLPLFLMDSLLDSIMAHDVLIDETGLPYSKIVMKLSIVLTTILSVVRHWKLR